MVLPNSVAMENSFVNKSNSLSSNITPSNYTGDLAVSGTANSDAIPAGAKRVHIEGDATAVLHFLFGASQAEAETVTTSTGMKLPATKDRTINIPSGATHVGFIASGAGTINVTYGV